MARFQHGSLIYNINTEILNSDKTLVVNSEQLQFLDPNGQNRKIYLPSATQSLGLSFVFCNVSDTYNLQLYSDTTSLICNVTSKDVVPVFCNGTVWRADVEPSPTRNVVTVGSNYSILNSDDVILVDASSGNLQIILPSPTLASTKNRDIKKIDSSSNTVTILPNGVETIDGGSSLILTDQNQSKTLTTNNVNWYLI